MSALNGRGQAVEIFGADGESMGTEGQPLAVTVTNVTTPVELTGDLLVDTLGALNDAAETDPDAASATIPALLRGVLTSQAALLTEMQAQTALLTTIAANTAPA